MADKDMKRGIKRILIIAFVLWVGYWGYEALTSSRAAFSAADTFGPDGLLVQAYLDDREFAKKMLVGGPIVSVLVYFVGRWIVAGFKQS